MPTASDKPVPDRRLPKARRLSHRRDIGRAFDAKCSASDDRLIVYAVANDAGFARVAVIASAKLGGAVVRNRYKRLLREAFRLNQSALPAGFDFVLIPHATGPYDLAQYAESLIRVAERAVAKWQRKAKP